MRSRFDGLRTILGTAAAAVPEVAAPAVVESVAKAPASNLPDLSDLDRGLYDGDGAAIPSAQSRTDALDQRDPSLELDDTVFGATPRATVRQRATARSAQVRRFPSAQHDEEDASEYRISGWTAVAVMVLGLFLGGTAAIAVFRSDVAHILARLQ
jgi:hypothetical protein